MIMMEMSEEKENISQEEICYFDNNHTFAIGPNFSSTMGSLNIIASQSHSPPPRLSSLNGSSDTRNVTAVTRSSSKNSNVTVARGIKNRNNLNTKSDQNENSLQCQLQQQYKHFLCHVHLNDDSKRMDPHSNGSFSPQNIQTDQDVRYNRCSSSSTNCSFTGNSYTKGRSGELLSTQQLDSFLDLYEEKHNLEPLDKNQVQGLSSNFNMSSLPLSGLITGTSQNLAFYQKSAQISQKDSQNVLIPSPCSSVYLSWLPAAAVSQDDIQDKSLSNNNNSKEILNSQDSKQPLSSIKEESTHVTNILRNVTKNSYHDRDQNWEKEMKDATIFASIPAAIKKSKFNVDNAEVDDGKSSNVAAKKPSDLKSVASATSPPPQQPQHIGNSKNALACQERKDAKTVKKELPVKSVPTPEVTEYFLKRPNERNVLDVVLEPKKIVAQPGANSSASLLPSKIPVPLPKTKENTPVNREKTCTPSVTLSKICNDHKTSRNDSSNSSIDSNTTQQVQKRAAVEKAEVDKIKSNSNHNTFEFKKQLLAHSPVSAENGTTLQTNSNPGSRPFINEKPKREMKKQIGEGDEVLECLSLIDGLSGHTTWVMNKLLEFPVSEEDAMKRIKKLKECPCVGDFFGVPYIKKEMLAHLLFNGGISEENVNNSLI